MANGTGTGGFNIDGKLQTYDVGVVKEEESSTPYDPGAVKVDGRPKDISNGTKKTLASYLSKVTLGRESPLALPRKPNAYPIDGDIGPPSTLLDPYGNTPPLPTGGPNVNKFAKDGPALRSRSDDSVDLDSKFKRGLSATSGPNPEDGHNLFQNVAVPPGGAGSLLDATVVLTGGGDFGAGTEPFSPGTKKTELNEKVVVGSYTKKLLAKNRFAAGQGTYTDSVADQLNPQQFVRGYKPGSSKAPDDAVRVSFGQLAQVGTNLMVRTTKELGSTRDGYSPASSAAEANAILPTFQQIGIERIEMELLQAKSVFDALPFVPIKNEQLTDFSKLSWGALNSALDQYSGVTNFGMQLLAVSLVVSVTVAIDILGLVLSLLMPSTVKKDKSGRPDMRDRFGRLPIGSSVANNKPIDTSSVGGMVSAILSGNLTATAIFGVRPTKNADFWKCLLRGSLAFFGLDGDGAAAVLKNSLSLTQHPGYVTAVARSFSRAFLRIADSFKELSKAFGVGLTSGIKQLFSLLDTFRTSRFISAITVFANLGDIVLGRMNDPKLNDGVANNGFGAKKSYIDALPNGSGASHYKNRLLNVSNPMLAWSTARATDMLVLPDISQKIPGMDRPNFYVEEVGGITKSPYSIYSTDASSEKLAGREANRLSTELREQMENSLESEYVPFYLHDVRTNEIVSFHAFLASLSDSYSSTYDSIEGFGRVEPIKTYKSTSRKMDFSFYLVATNPLDFDYMWTKINKITTLVYPQYTRGKEIVTTVDKDPYRITAPFSQQIGAAPMVRLRIGDLVKSNYSKFGLARLFGYGNAESNFGGEDVQKSPNNPITGLYDKKLRDVGTIHYMKDLKDYVSQSERALIDDNRNSLPAGYVAEILEVVEELSEESDEEQYTYTVKIIADPNIKSNPEEIRAIEALLEEGLLDREFKKVDRHSLTPTAETKKKAWSAVKTARAVRAEQDEGFAKAAQIGKGIENFMNEENNPISRSFKNSGGKGLAGFIESLTFDWYDRTPWELNAMQPEQVSGRRAPMMCKVSIGFSPIHDISPGLDHNGFNRAPIYPVGPFNPNPYGGK